MPAGQAESHCPYIEYKKRKEHEWIITKSLYNLKKFKESPHTILIYFNQLQHLH